MSVWAVICVFTVCTCLCYRERELPDLGGECLCLYGPVSVYSPYVPACVEENGNFLTWEVSVRVCMGLCLCIHRMYLLVLLRTGTS